MTDVNEGLPTKALKLNQIIAIEKGVKTRVGSAVTQAYRTLKEPSLFNGFTKTYKPKDEDGEKFADQTNRVQFNANDVLSTINENLIDLFDVTATKDFGNCSAKADIVVDGQVLMENVPATYLLFLEKKLNRDIREVLESVPVLSPDQEWQPDTNSNLYRAAEQVTTKTKKVQKPIVLYDATEEHPAQTQLITEDQVVGDWSTVGLSGAIPATRKTALLNKVDKLLRAVKMAREEANNTRVEPVNVGEKVFNYLFG